MLVCAQISQLFLASLHRLQTEIKFEPIKEIKINTIVQKDNGRTMHYYSNVGLKN